MELPLGMAVRWNSCGAFRQRGVAANSTDLGRKMLLEGGDLLTISALAHYTRGMPLPFGFVPPMPKRRSRQPAMRGLHEIVPQRAPRLRCRDGGGLLLRLSISVTNSSKMCRLRR